MYGNDTPSPPPKVSRAASSRRKLMALASRSKTGLAVDTTVTRHNARAPQQVFPYESKIDDHRAAAPHFRMEPPKQHLEDRLPFRSHGNSSRTGNDKPLTAMHKRIKGLRPTPLDLSTDLSPSDRAIPIGLAVPLKQPSRQPKGVRNNPPLSSEESLFNTGVITPTIVVTPAKENFCFTQSPVYDDFDDRYRPTSSIYSRHTNCMPKNKHYSKTPPVPPLPLFAENDHLQLLQDSRGSSTSVVEATADKHQSRNVALSVCTPYDDDTPMPRSAPIRDSRRITRQSHLPTPLRNKGWWNLITSPFSANSNAFFWRSPSIGGNDEDMQPMMSETSAMGLSNPLFGRIFNGRKEGDDELRSAPADHADSLMISKGVHDTFGKPKRSFTAPDALDINSTDINIYRIPSCGEAASYYDRNRHFPSLIMPSADEHLSRGEQNDEAMESRGVDDDEVRALSAAIDDASKQSDRDGELQARLRDMESRLAMMEQRKDLSTSGHTAVSNVDVGTSDEHNVATSQPLSDATSDTPANAEVDRAMFTSPSAEELATPPNRNDHPARSDGVMQSAFSPLSPSPVVASAHIAQVVGPGSARGEQFEVAIPPTRDSPPNNGLGLGAATMASRSVCDIDTEKHAQPCQWQPSHARQQSRGLGITDANSELYPPPQPLSEKFTLGTDRYRQLTLRSIDDPEEPIRPWYREFFWLLVSSICFLLILMIVLLVVFVPQKHDDTPIQAQWLNLTGFPALPTGIATVVQPKNIQAESSCVQQSDLWTCAASSEQQAEQQAERGSSLPNFRFEIRFRNGTTSNETDLVPVASVKLRRSGNTVEAGHTVRRALLTARSSWSSYLYSASPSPPSEDDQIFLGNTTDNNTMPYNGEETPFFISLLDATALAASAASRLQRRDGSSGNFQFPYPSQASESGSISTFTGSTSAPTSTQYPTAAISSSASTSSADSSSPSASQPTSTSSAPVSSIIAAPTLANVPTLASTHIPDPAQHSNGKPLTPELYPFASAQPLRLYNRGRADEHYGFYTYFDRAVYVSDIGNGTQSNASSGSGSGSSAAISEEGSKAAAAAAICTWSQTRFRVQIWTRRGTLAPLPSSTNNTAESVTASNSSANTLTPPGSFPYPVTVSLDRHGGAAGEKGVFCYGLDGEGKVVDAAKMWIYENRGVGGELVNPAQMPGTASGGGGGGGGNGNGTAVTNQDSVSGGIDGGTGGCGCSWSSLST